MVVDGHGGREPYERGEAVEEQVYSVPLANNRLKLTVTPLAVASVAPAAETERYPDEGRTWTHKN